MNSSKIVYIVKRSLPDLITQLAPMLLTWKRDEVRALNFPRPCNPWRQMVEDGEKDWWAVRKEMTRRQNE